MKIEVCMGSSCHAKGASRVLDLLREAIAANKLEDKISKVEDRIMKLKKLQFDEEIYNDLGKMKEIDEEINKLEEELSILSEEYLKRA